MKYLWLVLGLLLLCAPAWSVTGSGSWIAPTSFYDVDAWTKCDSIYVSDNLRATNATNGAAFAAKSFGLSLPDSMPIDSIDVAIEGYSTGTTSARRVMKIQLSSDGGVTGVGDTVTDTLSGTEPTNEDVQYQYGKTNRLWAASLTEAQIENANFAVRITGPVTTLSGHRIDQVRVRIWYHGTKAHFSFGRGSNEAIDCGLRETNPTTNYGLDANTSMGFGGGSTSGHNTILTTWKGLKDSLWGRTVDTMKITWNVTTGGCSFTSSPQFAFYIVRPARDWDTATATYNIWKTANNWTTAGAYSTASDIFASALNQIAGNVVVAGDNTFTITAVGKAIDGNDTTSLGFVFFQISGDDEGGCNIASANSVTATIRPYLEVWTHAGVESSAHPDRRRRHANSRRNQ